MRYQVFPLFNIRVAGLPFDAIARLGTPVTVARAREVVALKGEAVARGDTLLAQMKAAGVRTNALRRCRKKVDDARELPSPEPSYAEAWQAYEDARRAVESAASAMADAMASETAAARKALHDETLKYLPAFSVFGSTEAASTNLVEGMSEEGEPVSGATAATTSTTSDERKRDRHRLLYLQRVAGKNDTISEWGPTSWGWVDGAVKGARLDAKPGMAKRDVYVERWVVDALAADISNDPDAQPHLKPTRHPLGSLDGERFVRHDAGRAIELDAVDVDLVRRADGTLSSAALGDPARVQRLVDDGVLHRAMQGPELTAHRLERVREDVAAWPDGPARQRWLPVADEFLSLQRRFAEVAHDAPQRHEVMKSAAARAFDIGGKTKAGKRLLYTASNALGENCIRDSGLTISEELADDFVRDAEPWLDLWRDTVCYIGGEVARQLRPWVAEAPRHHGRVLLPAFHALCAAKGHDLTQGGLLALGGPAVKRVQQCFADRLSTRERASEWLLTAEDCSVVRDVLKPVLYDEFTYPSADFLVAAPSLDAALTGSGCDFVLGELHAPVVMLQHAVYWGCPDREALARGMRPLVGDLGMLHYGNARVSASCHMSAHFHDAMGDRFRMASSLRGQDHWRNIPDADIEVFIDEPTGDVRMRHVDTGEVLGSFGRDWIPWIAFHPFVFPLPPHAPRLRLGRVIVQRQSWTIRAEELDQTIVLPVAVEQMRAAHALPRFLYIRPAEGTFDRGRLMGKEKDRKAVLVDLESTLGMEVFALWSKKYPALDVAEMLPEPERLPWREADGCYSFEIRALIVPREPSA